ncbi:hypothetical protein B7Y94_00670 [Candidatus Saccharibacteria bacterium 32-49-12]|nr:MAG: hypothetical protein B7Y94_00670 [Candidatus Saccharibacteria bacterium 32-49-12]
MKDITRIHIAKVPYSVELSAKRQLEKYIEALEAYTADTELLQDIEIRITELLSERGVKQEAVISEADVEAIREQLGEPKEFLTDEGSAEIGDELLASAGVRRLYRNPNGAMFGGVLSGMASYLRVDVLWLRLIFIVLLFASVGFAALFYAVAWLIIPPARTAAEKLQLAGRPVTIDSIRQINEADSSIDLERRSALVKRIVTIVVGIGASIVAIGATAAILIVTAQLVIGQDVANVEAYRTPLTLMYISGALLVALSLVVAYAAFSQKFNKRIWISAVVITLLGLISFGAAITGLRWQDRLEIEAAQLNMVNHVDRLPTDFNKIKKLQVEAPEFASVTYIVDPLAATIKQRIHRDSAKASVTVTGDAAKIVIADDEEIIQGLSAGVTVHGPALDEISINNGYISYLVDDQNSFRVKADNSATVSVDESRIENFVATLGDSARLIADAAALSTVDVTVSDKASVALGNIKSLAVTTAEACAAGAVAEVDINSVLMPTYQLNGAQTTTRSVDGPCYDISIDDSSMDE